MTVFEIERIESISIIYIIIYIILINKYTVFFNNCHLSSVIIESVKIARPARYRRKVIHDGRKLQIRGLDVTVRRNWAISC